MNLHGYRIVPDRTARKPRLERVTFSGGRNVSAAQRNAKRLADARRVYIAGDMIIVPAWYAPEFTAQLTRALAARRTP